MRKLKTIVKVVSIVLAIIVGALIAVSVIPGFSFLMVKSESMKPEINVGDVIITGPVNGLPWTEIKPGTIITFEKDDALISHRVVSLEGDTLITKGDANKVSDSPIKMTQVKGVYLFRIPYVGYATHFIRTKMGWWLTILVPAGVLVGLLIKDILKEAFKPEEKRGGKNV